MKIVIDDKIPFIKGVFEPYAEVLYKSGAAISAADVHDADAIITRTRTKCNAALLQGSKVSMIATATIGFDHIDTAYCNRNNIEWTNSPGCNSGSVKQYLGAVLATLHTMYPHKPINQCTLGVVGVGYVGTKVASLGRALGMTVLLNDPPRADRGDAGEWHTLEQLALQCDVVTFHTPLFTDGKYKTEGLADRFLQLPSKPGQVLVNTSRGEVASTSAVVSALNTQRLAQAVIDVWDNEPDILPELAQKALIATPHIAGYSADGKAMGTAMVVRALSKKFGFPLLNWFPPNVPLPENTTLTIDQTGLSPVDVACRAILATYPIAGDVERLRKDLSAFEYLRGAYPLRREFECYTADVKNILPETAVVLQNLGFKI